MCTTAEPLWKLTRETTEWTLGHPEQKAFKDLKEAISTKCVAYFNISWDTEITKDASPVCLGAVLGQVNPANPLDRRIVSFASRLLTETERRYRL